MSACLRHKETLMLDIFDELSENRRASWKQHLNSCPDCTAEKITITQALDFSKIVLKAPALGEAEAAAMRENVIRNLTFASPALRKRKPAFFFSRAFVPALASACVLLIVLGLAVTKLMTGPDIGKNTQFAALREQLPREDIEIINNIDLLSDLDALNKLSRAIDRSQPPSPHNNIQGKEAHGKISILS